MDSKDAEKRLMEVGNNRITQSKSITFRNILWEEVKEPLILLLLAIGVMYSVWGDIGDTIMIIFVVLTVSLVEVFTEYKAKKSIESLKTLARPTTWVIRDENSIEIPTNKIVPVTSYYLKAV